MVGGLLTVAAMTLAVSFAPHRAEAGDLKVQPFFGKGSVKKFQPMPLPQPQQPVPGVQPKLFIQPPHHQNGPLLGIYGQSVPGYGMRVNSVVPGTIASRVGLEPGDIVTGINGQSVQNRWALQQAMSLSGRYISLTVADIRGTGLVNVSYDRWTGHVASSYGPGIPVPVGGGGPMMMSQSAQ